MRKVHDRGGWPNEDPIDHDEHEMEEWERQVDALNSVLGEKGLKNTDRSEERRLGKECRTRWSPYP